MSVLHVSFSCSVIDFSSISVWSSGWCFLLPGRRAFVISNCPATPGKFRQLFRPPLFTSSVAFRGLLFGHLSVNLCFFF